MQFASVRIITDDVKRLVDFYERVTGQSARWSNDDTAILEFLVDDVDGDYKRLQEWVTNFVNSPTTMPWGNRSLLFRDPDGNLINLFTPVTDEAVKKFLG